MFCTKNQTHLFVQFLIYNISIFRISSQKSFELAIVQALKCSIPIFSSWYYCSLEQYKSMVSIDLRGQFRPVLKLAISYSQFGISAGTIVRNDIKGRLLTPAEGCGFSNVATTRIVGGTTASVGSWPWMALFGRYYSKEYKVYIFSCGNLRQTDFS